MGRGRRFAREVLEEPGVAAGAAGPCSRPHTPRLHCAAAGKKTACTGRHEASGCAAMKCVVVGGNVKVLGKAVHALSRIGDELYLEPTENGLSLRAVNSSRSAYACFLFAPLFFQLYEAGGPDAHGELFRCKILMKTFLAIFRSLPSLEKTVSKCLISLNPRASRLVVQLHCKYGVTKTHNLSFQECELLQAIFDKQLCTSTLCASARVLVDAVVHFPVTLAEVTLGVGPSGKVSLRNYVDEETEPSKTMVTELCLSEDEFQDVRVPQETQITFCLKEFRGLLSFAESSNLPLSIHFDTPGRPAVFSLEDPLLEVHLVLATLADSSASSQAQTANGACHKRVPDEDFAADDLESYMIAMETTTGDEGAEPPPSPTFPMRCPSPATALEAERSTLDSDKDEDEDGAVPGTPPQKKFRSLFFGSVLIQAQARAHPTPSQEVLAEDSEGEC
ncbi:PREDICTED: cell cycle checkpoint control protein RAD9A isoform X1 [Crocodylus porosus]|uniref:cell cycle checkpoint control protein RAD9A isoform X1 n=1 Tax=Crocodylus porosus TaxID=8502 RepID=UPI00093D8C42|nr:PREDICTED: cell cycle checkpoint control protein RAD9A isoform X1 [Crocodylus porosus]